MKYRLLLAVRIVATLGLAALACWLSGVQPRLHSLLLVPGFLGLALSIWAGRLNPEGGKIGPAPIPSVPVKTGPYRLFSHPMYVGQSAAMVFFMWYAAGFWAAISIGLLAEILFREYIWREEGSPLPNWRKNSVVGERPGEISVVENSL